MRQSLSILQATHSESHEIVDEEGTFSKQAFLTQHEIDAMSEAFNRFSSFIENIGDVKFKGIRNDALEHTGRGKIKLNDYYDPEDILKLVKNRIDKMIKNRRIKKNWSVEDVKILTWIVSKYSDYKGVHNIGRDLNVEDWKYIASLIPGVEVDGCMFKWLGLKKNNLTEHAWGQRQSQLLEKVVKKYGDGDWGLISQRLYFMNTNPHKIYRCAKQCREHWNCYLNPNLKKGPWTKQEDILLLSIIKHNQCQKRWAEMVTQFQGRTENALKNRYTLIMDKQRKLYSKSQKLTELEIVDEYLQRTYIQQFVETKKAESLGEERMSTRRKEPQQFQLTIEDNRIERMPLYSMDELPSMQNISIVTLSSEQLKSLTESILSDGCKYVPCAVDNNRLKKISQI